jgi:hypothetical protein
MEGESMTRRVGLVCVVLLLGASLAGATTLVKMGFPDLARGANHVVVGTVTGVEGEWDANYQFIHTNVTLSVERSLRGAAPSVIVLHTPGGEVGGEGQIAEGAATFELGERVLVFVTTGEDGFPTVLGWTQGKSRIVTDDDGVERLQGGSGNGLTIAGAVRELQHGPDVNIPLQPAN